MDMIYRLRFRDWMDLDKAPGRVDLRAIARAANEEDISSGDGNGGRDRKRTRG